MPLLKELLILLYSPFLSTSKDGKFFYGCKLQNECIYKAQGNGTGSLLVQRSDRKHLQSAAPVTLGIPALV